MHRFGIFSKLLFGTKWPPSTLREPQPDPNRDPFAVPDLAKFRVVPGANSEDGLLILDAVRSEANKYGMSVNEYMEKVVQDASLSTYPTPECLGEEEINEYRYTGELPPSAQAHVDICIDCRGVIGAIVVRN